MLCLIINHIRESILIWGSLHLIGKKVIAKHTHTYIYTHTWWKPYFILRTALHDRQPLSRTWAGLFWIKKSQHHCKLKQYVNVLLWFNSYHIRQAWCHEILATFLTFWAYQIIFCHLLIESPIFFFNNM